MKHSIWSVVLVVVFNATASAQQVSDQCPPGTLGPSGPDITMVAQDACQKAIDLFQYLAPQLGVVLTGGNTTQGTASTLGGLGHFRVGLRANAMISTLPEIEKITPHTRGAQQSTYTLRNQAIGLPTADVAVGIFRGIPALLTYIGGVDVLVSAAYLPSFDGESIDITVPSGQVRLGYGAKLGILQESPVVPGVSVSVLTRQLPKVDVVASAGDDRLFLRDIEAQSRATRLVVGKSFLFAGAAAGIGQDVYDANATISVTVAPREANQGGSGGPVLLEQRLTRTNVFANFWFTSQVLKLVGEIGRVSGGKIVTYNAFSGTQAADPRTYVSLGVTFGL